MTTQSSEKTEKLCAISNALVHARLEASVLDGFPGEVPETTSDAYAIQHRSIGIWPSSLAGFKVGGVPPSFRNQYNASWLAGPVFDDAIFHIANGEHASVPVFENGFAAYEAEWVFVTQPINWKTLEPVALDDAKSFVSEVHIGTEIASSPMPMINDLGPGSIISDFGNNASVWIGPKVNLSILDRLETVSVSVHIDGALIGRATPNAGGNGPLGALTFLLNHLREFASELTLPETIVVSSGAVTGVHSAKIGSKSNIVFEGIGEFSLSMMPKAPSIS